MQSQNNNNSDFEDDFYEDVLEENFEDDFDEEDYADIDLDDDSFDPNAELSLNEEEDDFDEEWDMPEGNDYIESGAGAQKEKKFNFGVSFNTIAITGAIIVGVVVLLFQVTAKKPETVERFMSALNMSGASDGPVFGKTNEVVSTEIETANIESTVEETKGFLYEPDILDTMEMETPPMPAPIAAEPVSQEAVNAGNTLTPLPGQDKAIKTQQSDTDKVPRPPVTSEGNFEEDAVEGITMADKKEEIKEELPKAEDFLKTAIKARNDKKEEVLSEGQKIADIQVPDNAENPTTEEIPGPDLDRSLSEAPSDFNNADNTVFDQRLNVIVSRLDDIERQVKQIQESEDSRIKDVSEGLDLLKKEIGQLDKKSEKTITAPKPKITAVPKKRNVTKKASRVIWELRAAQPGKAWVSKKGQNEIQSVVLGDNLPDIGRITSIAYNKGRWVVQGTSGQIRQY